MNTPQTNTPLPLVLKSSSVVSVQGHTTEDIERACFIYFHHDDGGDGATVLHDTVHATGTRILEVELSHRLKQLAAEPVEPRYNLHPFRQWRETNRLKRFARWEDEIAYCESQGYKLAPPLHVMPHWSIGLYEDFPAPQLYVLRASGELEELRGLGGHCVEDISYPLYYKPLFPFKAQCWALEADLSDMKKRFCEHHAVPGAVKPGCPECARLRVGDIEEMLLKYIEALSDGPANLSGDRAEELEIMARSRLTGESSELEELREFVRQADADGLVPASRVAVLDQQLNEVLKELAQLKEELEQQGMDYNLLD